MLPDVLLGNFFESDQMPCSFSNGITSGFITAYYGDIIANFIYDDNKDIYNLLKVRSGFSNYFASTVSGGIGGITALYLDGIANNIVVTVFFFILIYLTDHYVSKKDDDTSKTARDLTFDTVAVIILLAIFGPNADKSFNDRTLAADADTDYLALLIINIYFALRGED